MYTKLIGKILEGTRPELLGAALVVIYGGSYLAAYFLFQLFANLIGWNIRFNFIMLNVFIGCIGIGELSRGLVKVVLKGRVWSFNPICTGIAGAACAGTFWVLMVFKWSQNTFSQVPIAALAGSAIYLVLAGLMAIDGRKKL